MNLPCTSKKLRMFAHTPNGWKHGLTPTIKRKTHWTRKRALGAAKLNYAPQEVRVQYVKFVGGK